MIPAVVRPGVVALLLATAACSHDAIRTDTGKAMILPAGAQTMTLPEDRDFVMAVPIEEPLPEYPAGLAATAHGAIEVCAEFVVDTDGAVRIVTPLYGLPECPAPQADIDPRYVDAVAAALRRWQYFAAATCTLPAGMPRNHDCEGEGVEATPVAIKLAYVFTFRAERGRASVTGRASGKRERS